MVGTSSQGCFDELSLPMLTSILPVLLSSESMTALDAVKLGDFGLGVVLGGAKDPTTYAGTKIYLPPV